jgi:putative ATPase
MKRFGYGEGYRYVHDDPAAQQEQSHLPLELEGIRYYSPKKN